jgi:hypothetical protein
MHLFIRLLIPDTSSPTRNRAMYASWFESASAPNDTADFLAADGDSVSAIHSARCRCVRTSAGRMLGPHGADAAFHLLQRSGRQVSDRDKGNATCELNTQCTIR